MFTYLFYLFCCVLLFIFNLVSCECVFFVNRFWNQRQNLVKSSAVRYILNYIAIFVSALNIPFLLCFHPLLRVIAYNQLLKKLFKPNVKLFLFNYVPILSPSLCETHQKDLIFFSENLPNTLYRTVIFPELSKCS